MEPKTNPYGCLLCQKIDTRCFWCGERTLWFGKDAAGQRHVWCELCESGECDPPAVNDRPDAAPVEAVR